MMVGQWFIMAQEHRSLKMNSVNMLRSVILLGAVLGSLCCVHAGPLESLTSEQKNILAEGVKNSKRAIASMPVMKMHSNKFEDKKAWTPKTPRLSEEIGFWTELKRGTLQSVFRFKKIAAVNSTNIWAIGEDNKIYQNDGTGWKAQAIGIDIAASSDGTVVGINAKNQVYRFKRRGVWERIPNIALTHLDVGHDGYIIGVKQDGDTVKMYKYRNKQWRAIKTRTGTDVTGYTKVAVNELGEALALDCNGNICHLDPAFVRTLGKTKKICSELNIKRKPTNSVKVEVAKRA